MSITCGGCVYLDEKLLGVEGAQPCPMVAVLAVPPESIETEIDPDREHECPLHLPKGG